MKLKLPFLESNLMHKARIQTLEESVLQLKSTYSIALESVERHRDKQQHMLKVT